MKIAICSVQEFNPSIGGIERVSNSLAEALIGRGVDVMFIACRKSPYSKEYTLPAKQYILPNSADYALENVNAFSEIVKEEKVDIILNQNAHSELYNRTCYEVKAITGVKLISAYHFDPASRIKANRKNLNLSLLTNKEYLINMLKNICTRFPFQYITMYDQCRMFRNLYYNCDKVVLLSKEFIPNYLKYANLKETDKLSAIGNMLSFPYDNNATFHK